MIRITLVSYLNTKPFIEGLTSEFPEGEILLDLRPPSGCAASFRNGECDLALVPAGALDELGESEILTDWCIGSKGKVDSVFLFSDVPVGQISTVILDPDSRTSNLLTRVLFKHFWKQNPLFMDGNDRNFEETLPGTARVAIGDVAHSIRTKFPFAWDLSSAWKDYSGLPFVFAVWVARPGKLSPDFLQRLEHALGFGVKHLDQVASKYAAEAGFSREEAFTYLSQSLDFHFDEPKRKALELFLQLSHENAPEFKEREIFGNTR